MYYIPQLSKNSCGMACLKMLLAIVQKDEGYLYLPEEENHGSYSYQELLIIAQRYDVTLMGLKIDDKDDLRHFKDFPMILTVNGPNETTHAVLVSQRKGNKIKIHDPAKGIYWEKVDKFIPKWDATVLSVSHVENHPYPFPVINIKDKKGDFISCLLQFITAACIGAATFFIKPEGGYLLPIIFASVSLLSELVLRFHLLKRMQRCDKYLRRFLPYVRSKDYYEFYKRSQEYKKCSLSMGLNLFFSLLIILLIVTISLINSLYFVILIIASLLAAYLDVFFFAPCKRELNKELSGEESDLHQIKDLEQMELQVKTMEVKSYRYAYYEFARKVVAFILLLIASIALSIVQKSFALTNIVFYTCLGLLLYQSMTPLFGYDDRVEENLLYKARINNVVHQNDENNSKIH